MALHRNDLRIYENGHQWGNSAGNLKKYNPQGGRVLCGFHQDRVAFAALINPALSTV